MLASASKCGPLWRLARTDLPDRSARPHRASCAAVTLGPVRFAQVGEDWVGYRTLGDRSEHAILILPTLASSVDMVLGLPTDRIFFERLAEFATVVFFDRRGTGVSDGVPNAIAPTLEDWADD